MSEVTTCAATTKAGNPCRGRPVAGSRYCAFHDPQRAAAVAAGRRAGGHSRRRESRSVALDVAGPRDVAAVLVGELSDLLGTVGPGLQRSRAVAYLAGVLLRAFEVGQLEDRLEALEARFSEGV